MIFVDTAFQDSGGFSGGHRAQLKLGYNALVIEGAEIEDFGTGLADIFYGKKEQFGASDGGRGVVTYTVVDRTTFRLHRDFSKKQIALQRYRSDSKDFENISTDPQQVQAHLLNQAGIPKEREDFERLFLLMPAQLLSFKGDPMSPPSRYSDAASIEKRLADIEQLLKQSTAVGEFEYELDGLQRKRFELEDAIKQNTFDDTRLNNARSAVAGVAYLNALPDDFATLYERYVRALERREQDEERWEREREELEAQKNKQRIEPIKSDRRFIGGILVGFGGILSGFLLGGEYRYLAFFDIPGFAVSAWVVWENLSARQERASVIQKLEFSDSRKTLIAERDSELIKSVQNILDETDLDRPEAVYEALERRKRVHQELSEAEREAQQAANTSLLQDSQKELTEVERRIEEIDTHLASWSGMSVDVAGLQAEAASLRGDMQTLRGGGYIARSETAAFLNSIAQLRKVSHAQVASAMNEQLAKICQSLSGNSVASVEYSESGELRVDGTPYDSAGENPQVLSYLCCRLAALALLSPEVRHPIWAADFRSFVPGDKLTMSRFLRGAAGAGQVIHLIRNSQDAVMTTNVARF